ncbi:hypothetical protein L3556_15135 [Candidatus Synechococcus calcipolaris G9]|uniref:DUF4115 domain-containing protein n=1 Tax=Candidatus Synechococcus calcipolaris G9 TaxID=1497997 RepID=A0ABT6F342_9SYNE|nr:hypothetical protein [Candidatus Synechococcus calcipolaris]MDG2992252.1 hypothetical protein [Candidatus Synechococcus calcipolaris G9]
MSDPPPSPPFWSGLWQKVRPSLLRETMVALESLISLGQFGLDRLKTQAMTHNIPEDALQREASFLVRLGPPLQSAAQSFWNLMGWLRSRFPEPWKERVSQSTLTTLVTVLVLVGVVVNPLGTFAGKGSSQAQTPPSLTSRPPLPSQPIVSPTPIAVQPPIPEVQPSPVIPDLTSLGDEPIPIAEADLPTIAPPENSLGEGVETVDDRPAPPPELSPEEAEIADIRSQILALSDRYREGITQTLTVNLANHTLEVMLSSDWYHLNTNKQDDLAQDLWQRSQDLGFHHFAIVDTQGDILVRNPVIGDNAIVLHRKLL